MMAVQPVYCQDSDTTVSAKVIKNGKGKKLNIITYRAKKHSARRMGHRQPFTKVEITAING